MRKIALAALLVTLACGCQEVQLRERAARLAGTVSDLHQQEVLDNLALLASKPGAMPYYLLPSQGTEQIARTIQATYTPGWDFITSGVYIGRYLFDKQTAALQGTNQNQETWQNLPISDPDKLLFMQSAYHSVLGIDDPYRPYLLQYYTTHSQWAHYEEMIQPGWLGVGGKKDVPKCACHVGHYCDTYIWVLPGHDNDLARLTLAILDIATVDTSSGVSATLAGAAQKGQVRITDKLIDDLPESLAKADVKEKLKKELSGRSYDTPQEAAAAIKRAVKEILGMNVLDEEKGSMIIDALTKGVEKSRTVHQPQPNLLTPRIMPVPSASPPASSPVP